MVSPLVLAAGAQVVSSAWDAWTGGVKSSGFAAEKKNASEMQQKANDLLSQLTYKNADQIRKSLSELIRKYPGYNQVWGPVIQQVEAMMKVQKEYKNNLYNEQKAEEQEQLKQEALEQLRQYGPQGSGSVIKPGYAGMTTAEYNEAVAPFLANKKAGDEELARLNAAQAQNPNTFRSAKAVENLNQIRAQAAEDTQKLQETKKILTSGTASVQEIQKAQGIEQSIAKKYGYEVNSKVPLDKFVSQSVESSDAAKKMQLDVDRLDVKPNADVNVGAGTAKSEAPVYKMELTPEMQKIQDYVNSVTVKMPELTPELVTQWKGKLDEINKPWEEQAANKLNEAFSSMNPLGYGSGSQKDATTRLIQEQEANKQAQALALGQTDVAQKLSEYDKAMNMALALGEYKDNANKIATDQERQDYWTNVTRKWQVEDVANAQAFSTETTKNAQGFAISQQDKQDAQQLKMLLATADVNLNAQQQAYKNQLNTLLKQRGWQVEDLITARAQELQDYNTKKSDTWEMINASKPAEVSPIQSLLTPILQGVASGAGAGAGTVLYNALTTKTPAQTSQQIAASAGAPAAQTPSYYNYSTPNASASYDAYGTFKSQYPWLNLQ